MQSVLAPDPANRTAPHHNVLAILSRRGFRRLVAVRLLSQLGDGWFQAGLAGSVFFNPEQAASPIAITAAFAVLLLPYSRRRHRSSASSWTGGAGATRSASRTLARAAAGRAGRGLGLVRTRGHDLHRRRARRRGLEPVLPVRALRRPAARGRAGAAGHRQLLRDHGRNGGLRGQSWLCRCRDPLHRHRTARLRRCGRWSRRCPTSPPPC